MRAMQVQAGAPLIPSSVPSDTPTVPVTSRRPLFVALVTAAVVVFSADPLTKAWVSANLEPGKPRKLVGSLLQINLTHNCGEAFSIQPEASRAFTRLASAVGVFIVFTECCLGTRV